MRDGVRGVPCEAANASSASGLTGWYASADARITRLCFRPAAKRAVGLEQLQQLPLPPAL